MISRLFFSHYRFTLVPETTINLPRLKKGSVLRGAFGGSLRNIVCAKREGETCQSCLLREKCAYALIFDPMGSNPARRLLNAPRGYVLKPPLEEETEYRPEKPLSFDMVLVGDRVNYLPYIIVPFMELGRVGIGLNRGRFRLQDIEILKNGLSESIYDSTSSTVRNIQKNITGRELIEGTQKLNRGRLALNFLTPTRIKYNPTGERGGSQLVRLPEFHHLLRRLRDRVNALSVGYCGGPIEIDFKEIAQRAMSIKTTEQSLRWVEIKRRSRSQSREHDLSGFVGRITFEGDLSEFLPLMVAGEYLHIGEEAVFGNGWYRIETV